MMIFPLFAAPETAIDLYCRRKLDRFSLAPQNPLQETSFPPSSSNPLPFRLRLRTYHTPIASGLATAGVAGAVIFAHTAHPVVPTNSQTPDQQNIITFGDTVKYVDDDVETMNKDTFTVQSSQPLTTGAKRHSTIAKTEDYGLENTAPTSDSTISTTETENLPVVVKKVRRKNRTIVIQDSSRQSIWKRY